MHDLTIKGELGRKLKITVQGYEREAASDISDANWLLCSVDVKQGSFRGEMNATFVTTDFLQLLTGLERVNSGSATLASFATLEEALTFQIEVDRAGRGVVTGILCEDQAFGSKLSFAFETDHSFLANSILDLKRIVESFPEVTDTK